jgi:hypothetical protein
MHADRAGIEGQETGVTGAAFGPATKDFYDSSQWAMVPTATAYIEDPVPAQRQRLDGQPAILKPSPNFNYLPALIPILHSIPQFRNALLSGATQKSYWVGDDWWRGSAVARGRVVDTTVDDADALGLDVVEEIQRLMAFLDNTDRAYATVESLLQLDAWKESRPKLEDPDDDLLKFLLIWSEAYQKQAQCELNGVLRSVVSAGGSNFESFVLDSTITKRESGRTPDVYDVLDDTFFATQEGSAHIVDISNVLILRLSSSRPDGNDLGCRVPATLYADRYLEQNRPIIDAMFEEMRRYECQLKDIKDQTDMLKYHTLAKKKPVESLKLLQTSMKAFQSSSNDAAVLAQLQALYDSIQGKLASLDEQSQAIQHTLDSISDRFKPPIDDGAESDAHGVESDAHGVESDAHDYPPGQRGEDATRYPYKLYGVSTRRDVIYLLHPDPKPDAPDAKQWWRVQYDSESTSPNIIRDRVDQQQVLERATSEAASVLLVYANEAAISEQPLPLPKPLQDFVNKDNLNFLEELQKSQEWEDEPSTVQGDWDKDPPGYNHDWANISAREFQQTRDSGVSSTTLTPNTDVDVDVDVDVGDAEVQEIVDIPSSNASTATIADTPSGVIEMDLDSQPARDTEMVDLKVSGK